MTVQNGVDICLCQPIDYNNRIRDRQALCPTEGKTRNIPNRTYVLDGSQIFCIVLPALRLHTGPGDIQPNHIQPWDRSEVAGCKNLTPQGAYHSFAEKQYHRCLETYLVKMGRWRGSMVAPEADGRELKISTVTYAHCFYCQIHQCPSHPLKWQLIERTL